MIPDEQSAADPGTADLDCLGTWRAELKSFFETDRDKLRRLIMQLEERTWSMGARESGAAEPAAAGTRTEQLAAERSEPVRLTEIPQPQLQHHVPQTAAEANAEQDERKRHRLADLAETIEQRIRTANARLG